MARVELSLVPGGAGARSIVLLGGDLVLPALHPSVPTMASFSLPLLAHCVVCAVLAQAAHPKAVALSWKYVTRFTVCPCGFHLFLVNICLFR